MPEPVAQASEITETRPTPSPPSPPPPRAMPVPEPPSPDDLRSDSLSVRYDDRRYGVTWLESPSLAQLRAHARLDLLPEAADDGALPLVTYLDTVNLASGRSRDGFIRRVLQLVPPAAETLLPQKDVLSRLVEADLMRLFDLGELRRKNRSLPKPSASVMTDERRKRAHGYLQTPHLLVRLAEDLDAMGYVGERKAKVLGYLVSISRKLPQALSMVILSSSGSGKSALAEVLEKLCPEEDILVVTRFTGAALYWLPKDAIKRKFVSIEERTGSEEADYALRALQSKGRISLMVPIKDQATGKIESVFIFVEGPASTLESTTESEIFFENATRCFEVRLDESPEQTRRIQEAQRFGKTPEGQRSKGRAEEIAALHRDVQRCLRVVKVGIPWADLLEFPSTWTRNRRDHPRFLNLIEVIAFLHQHQRSLCYADSDEPCQRPLGELSDDELAEVYVEADVEDYGAAKALYGEILLETMADLKKPLMELYEVCKEMVKEHQAAGKDAPLYVRELRSKTRLDQRVLRRQLAELVELEYLSVARGANGLANAYRLVELAEGPSAFLDGLLSVEELKRRIEERKKKSAGGRP